MNLSKRLLTCARYTDGFLHLADIGTDHAKLPIHAVESGYVMDALAIDNKEGPYVIAFSNVKKAELEDKIKVVLGDGISKITEETDVVVISGMGGGLIKDILSKDPIKNVKRFILQPNNDAKEVRHILPQIGFKVVDELVLEDGNKFYDIIIIERGESNLTSFEEEFGPINLKLKPYYFVERINKEMKRLERIASNLKNSPTSIGVKARIELLKEALK